MKTSSLNQPHLPPPTVKNILIRYCHPSLYSENSNLLRHFPRYYKNLPIDITPQNPLLSKIKKLKKLKSFIGYIEKDKVILQTLWFSLFKPHRKSIERIPKMETSSERISRSYRKKLTIKEMKFFYNITQLHLSILRLMNLTSEQWKSLSIYIGHMRHLKRLRIWLDKRDYEKVKGIIGQLDKMERLLATLEHIKLYVSDYDMDIQEFFGHKNFMGHLTSLEFHRDVLKRYPFLGDIPRACTNLRYLSLHFRGFFSETPEFKNFLASIRDLPNLEGVNFQCEKNTKEFLKIFSPKKSLRYLKLFLEFSNMKDLSKDENLVQHWEDLNQLETLNLYLVCRSAEMMSFMRILVTMILKKIPKLTSFECLICIGGDLDYTPSSYAPFFIEQVPHLYESLEKLKTSFCDCYPLPSNVNFNLNSLKVFKNLKKIKIKGECLHLVKIKEAIEQLEIKRFSRLNLKGLTIGSKNDLKKILEEISKAKRGENNNIKIKLEFEYNVKPKGEELNYLKKFCHVIESVEPIKGLLISLNLNDCSERTIKQMENVMKGYPNLQNCILALCSSMERLEYRKINGVKEKFCC